MKRVKDFNLSTLKCNVKKESLHTRDAIYRRPLFHKYRVRKGVKNQIYILMERSHQWWQARLRRKWMIKWFFFSPQGDHRIATATPCFGQTNKRHSHRQPHPHPPTVWGGGEGAPSAPLLWLVNRPRAIALFFHNVDKSTSKSRRGDEKKHPKRIIMSFLSFCFEGHAGKKW